MWELMKGAFRNELHPYLRIWIWRRRWRFQYQWLRPVGHAWFRCKIGLNRFMPAPCIYLLLKLGSKQREWSIGPRFEYAPEFLRAVEVARNNPRFADWTPYRWSSRTETRKRGGMQRCQ